MELKKYQQKAIDKVNNYLTEVGKYGPKNAFISITEKPYKEEFFGKKVLFICIKIPTGGGKTLVGCHSVTNIMDLFLQEKMDKGIVMWFVPSEAIKSQTLRKFKDRKDIHRQILDDYFDNNVKIFSIEEALKIRKEDVGDNLCIIISSLDAFRKEKSIQTKYKVYQENGALINHFENIEENDTLEKDESGVIKSLANVIRLNNPLIVLDEGHRTKTELSITFLKELNPNFVIEYTATPRVESNVLVDIHSSELKEEEIVKLPLVLESHTQWQQSVLQGVLRREELEKIYNKEKKEKVRPIALLQAEQEKEDDKWSRSSTQSVLHINYKDKNCTKKELVHWLDKKLTFKMLDKEDKVKFIDKAIDKIKGYTIQDLSINRYVLQEKLDEIINNILIVHSKKVFDKAIKDGKIKVKEFDVFPATITLSEEMPQEFNKSYYKKLDKLNKEEQRFVERIDLEHLSNIKFWIRVREKKDDCFYLRGWKKNRFYPDFIVVTKKGNILALEWKGEHLQDNSDTEYKVEVGKIWEKLGKGKLHFFLVGNNNVEEVLTDIKEL